MDAFDYFFQADATQSLRRYPKNAQKGERWHRENHCWVPECAERRACELSGDHRVSAAAAEIMTR